MQHIQQLYPAVGIRMMMEFFSPLLFLSAAHGRRHHFTASSHSSFSVCNYVKTLRRKGSYKVTFNNNYNITGMQIEKNIRFVHYYITTLHYYT
jgi:hypothetical protein